MPMSIISRIKQWLGSPGHKEPEPSAITVPSNQEFVRRGWIVGSWFNHDTLEAAIRVQHGWEDSRMVLQKVTYEITRPTYPEEQKVWFRQFMAQFVKRDPVYQSTIGRVLDAISRQPGMVQSEIYKGRSEAEKEGARYVLYFAHELGDIRREKAGRSYKLYLPGAAEVAGVEQQVGDTQHLAGGAMKARVVVRGPSDKEKQISELHKKATAAAGDKDFDKAVTYLEEACKLMPEVSVEHGIELYLRLPNYLQQSGRMEEARAEFEKLLATWQRPYDQAAIHNQMRIAYQREKQQEIAVLHGVQHILWQCIGSAERDRMPMEMQTAEHWAPKIDKLLKRARRQDLLDPMLERLMPFFAEPRAIAVESTTLSVRGLFDTHPD